MTDAPGVLVLNAGSSTIKFAVYRASGPDLQRYCGGIVDHLGDPATVPQFRVRNAAGEPLVVPRSEGVRPCDHHAALKDLCRWVLAAEGLPRLVAVGHRVVHGGRDFSAPVMLDTAIERALERLVPLAPLHQPHNLAGIRAVDEVLPVLPQVACFDTAFHAGQPELARLYALPAELRAEGVQRYGFHGLSYAYVSACVPRLLGHDGGRMVIAHLGNGASMCAVRHGHGVASTMGFTALEGLPMGTRTGSIDPGVLIHLMRTHGLDADGLEDLLSRRSGLLGLSGLSADMRVLLASDAPESRLAVAYFCYRAGRELGSLAAALGGLDTLVFTAGIGEHAAPVRTAIAGHAEWLGVRIDENANAEHRADISHPASRVRVLVVPTDEESVIAAETWRLAGTGKAI